MCKYILQILKIANQVLLVTQLKVVQYFLTVCPHDTLHHHFVVYTET